MASNPDHTINALSSTLRDLVSKKKVDVKTVDNLCIKYAEVIDEKCEKLRDPKRAFKLGERLLNAKPTDSTRVTSSMGKIAREHRGHTFESNTPARKPRAQRDRELRARGKGRDR